MLHTIVAGFAARGAGELFERRCNGRGSAQRSALIYGRRRFVNSIMKPIAHGHTAVERSVLEVFRYVRLRVPSRSLRFTSRRSARRAICVGPAAVGRWQATGLGEITPDHSINAITHIKNTT